MPGLNQRPPACKAGAPSTETTTYEPVTRKVTHENATQRYPMTCEVAALEVLEARAAALDESGAFGRKQDARQSTPPECTWSLPARATRWTDRCVLVGTFHPDDLALAAAGHSGGCLIELPEATVSSGGVTGAMNHTGRAVSLTTRHSILSAQNSSPVNSSISLMGRSINGIVAGKVRAMHRVSGVPVLPGEGLRLPDEPIDQLRWRHTL